MRPSSGPTVGTSGQISSLNCPKPYAVPASGTIPWLDFVIPTHFGKDTWVKAGEIRPGARSVVHHVSVSFIPPGPATRQLENAPPGEPVTLPRGIDNEFFLGFAPGVDPARFDIDDSPVLIPAGSYLVMNMHYDYGWQLGYIFEKPLLLPVGTRLDIYGHWDNSAANPYNPDPTATVHWGQQAWDEMFGGGVVVIIPRQTDPKTLLKKPGRSRAKWLRTSLGPVYSPRAQALISKSLGTRRKILPAPSSRVLCPLPVVSSRNAMSPTSR
jgi:hypothetical protein